MRTVLLAVLFALAAAPAAAQDASGRVRGLYYEAARGVLVDAGMLWRPGAIRWVDVELDDRQRALVQLPAHLEAGIGDRVVVQLAGAKGSQVASHAPLSVSRVIEVRPSTQLAAPSRP